MECNRDISAWSYPVEQGQRAMLVGLELQGAATNCRGAATRGIQGLVKRHTHAGHGVAIWVHSLDGAMNEGAVTSPEGH